MRRRTFLALTALAACRFTGDAPQVVPPLDPTHNPLREQFNRDVEHPRLLVLVSSR